MTASIFSFLSVPMHATMSFIVLFVLEIITKFNQKLSESASGAQGISQREFEVPEGLQIPAGVALPQQGELAGGLDIFGNQDMSVVAYMILLVVIILTVANALAPKFAAGGSNLMIVSFLSIMCIVSGAVLWIVPVLTGMLFSV